METPKLAEFGFSPETLEILGQPDVAKAISAIQDAAYRDGYIAGRTEARDESFARGFESGRERAKAAIDALVPSDEFRHTGIEILGLSTRVYNCLKRHGKHSIGDVEVMSDEDLTVIDYFGQGALSELDGALLRFGIVRDQAFGNKPR